MALSFDPFTEFDRLTAGLVPQRPSQRFMPVDLYRDGDEYVLSADLPGVDPGSVDIDIDGQLLTIRAQRTTASGTEGTEGTKWLAQERPSGSYLRQFTLGDGLDTERISANYDNGVLSVIIPVSERAKPRKVAVESRSSQTSISA